MTKLKHPESKQTIEVSDDDLDRFLSQGWEEPAKKADGK